MTRCTKDRHTPCCLAHFVWLPALTHSIFKILVTSSVVISSTTSVPKSVFIQYRSKSWLHSWRVVLIAWVTHLARHSFMNGAIGTCLPVGAGMIHTSPSSIVARLTFHVQSPDVSVTVPSISEIIGMGTSAIIQCSRKSSPLISRFLSQMR